jgi:hypothetical protein
LGQKEAAAEGLEEVVVASQAVAKVVNQVEAELSWPFELESPQGCKLH